MVIVVEMNKRKWKKKYYKYVEIMTEKAIDINSNANVKIERFNNKEEFNLAFNRFQEELKNKWK